MRRDPNKDVARQSSVRFTPAAIEARKKKAYEKQGMDALYQLKRDWLSGN